MICRYFSFHAMRQDLLSFKRILEISMVVDSWHSWYSNLHRSFFHENRACVTKVIYFWAKPTSKIVLPHKIDGLVIPSYKDSQERWNSFAWKILLEWTHLTILLRHMNIGKILLVSDSLKISTNQKNVNFLLRFLLHGNKPGINLLQLPMQTPLDSDIHEPALMKYSEWQILINQQ